MDLLTKENMSLASVLFASDVAYFKRNISVHEEFTIFIYGILLPRTPSFGEKMGYKNWGTTNLEEHVVKLLLDI